ncbi:MAG: hypothetical protein GY941_06095 [Planctomycetes bacterium]|nr:hypothetical protein [Planctomycetota bacterium]
MTLFPNPPKTCQELLDLLDAASKRKMTPQEIEEQRQSWVRSMTARCEHGEVDYEQCPECRMAAIEATIKDTGNQQNELR